MADARTKAHTRYYVDGERVPSVTTIINGNLGWNKNALVAWARREGMAGRDPNAVRDTAAAIGTIAHAMIEEYLTGRPLDRSLYAPADIDKAENAYLAYLDWEKAHTLEIIGSEVQMVHRTYRYGGTIDLLANLDGDFALVDFKTSSGLYPEHIIQLAAYQELVEHNKGKSPKAHLLWLGKEDGSFHHSYFPDLSQERVAFLLARRLHDLRGPIRDRAKSANG